MLSGCCCFLLNYHQEQIKRKIKKTWVREISLKRIKQGVYHNYCRRCVSMIETRISGYLYNKFVSKSNEEKCTVFQGMAWSLIVHENTIENCSTALQGFSFRSLSLSLCIFYFLFYKGNDTSAISRPSVQPTSCICSSLIRRKD